MKTSQALSKKTSKVLATLDKVQFAKTFTRNLLRVCVRTVCETGEQIKTWEDNFELAVLDYLCSWQRMREQAPA